MHLGKRRVVQDAIARSKGLASLVKAVQLLQCRKQTVLNTEEDQVERH